MISIILLRIAEENAILGGITALMAPQPKISQEHLGITLPVSNSALGLLYGHGILNIYENLLLS